MTTKFDAIIIGAGIIGCGIAFELAKKGYQTLNIDKLADADAGPTGNSYGCIRFFYSTYDGVAMSYEGYHYWTNWADYLGVEDERGYAGTSNGARSCSKPWGTITAVSCGFTIKSG